MEELYKVKSICEQLQATSGKKDKESILQNNANNQLFKDVLYFLLSPFVLTGISEKKINKFVNKPASCKLDSVVDVIEYLKEHNTGTDDDIANVQYFINRQEECFYEFYKQLFTKSLKLGVDATTVNKIYGDGFVPTFDVQLGTSIEKCKIPEGTWFSISHKINGTRCIFVDGDFYTRQGKKYTGLDHIKNDLAKLIADGLVVDGELVGKNTDGVSDSENFQRSTGVANSKSSDKSGLKLVVFDCIATAAFERGKSDTTYKDRKNFVEGMRNRIAELGLENVSVVDMFYEGTDQSEIWKWLDYAEEHDLEGVILNLDAPYECKRTKNLIKVKMFKEIELRCVDIKNGGGKYKNTLGSIVCKYKNNTVEVGSGFSDAQREYYWNNRNEILNRIISIKYKEVTKNKEGLFSLQFPIFQVVRFDKDIPDDE